MKATELFQKHLVKWLCKNGCSNLDVFFDSEFYYIVNNDTDARAVSIGILTPQTQLDWYKQFLYEYGNIQTSILDIILPFMHEVGHYFTSDNFSDFEQGLFDVIKSIEIGEIDNQKSQEDYWLIPNEMAANVWAINFINTHQNAMEELNKIFLMYWEDMIAEICEEEED